MKKKKSTKTYADIGNEFLNLIRRNADDSYFLEVLYYYIRRALISCDYNLREVDGVMINGRFLGYKLEVLFSKIFNTTLRSLGLALSIRALMLNRQYLKYCYNNRLLFYDLDNNLISWNAHQVIMNCINDEDFRMLYEMVVCYKAESQLSDEQKEVFCSSTQRPEYRCYDIYCRSIASDPSYDGKSVIKNNAYLGADFENFEIPNEVDYVGDTAFSYCKNLRVLTFTRKVLFGFFPIIECDNLKQIIVPTKDVDYYKHELPYYKDIICDKKKDSSEIRTEFDTDKIWHVFEKKATSYKYFWLLSIMEIFIKSRQITIPYKNLVAKMSAIAWNYAITMNLSLGNVDQLKKYLLAVQELTGLKTDSSKDEIEETIIEKYESLGLVTILAPLLKNVPYRFLSPWIQFTTKEEVVSKSNDKENDCLYGFTNDGIFLNPIWLEYLRSEKDKIIDFTSLELEKYLDHFNK